MNTTATTKGYFGDEFGDDANFDAPVQPTSNEKIRKEAHIANGGEAEFKCPSCKGRGRFISYAGRDAGPCFKCKGRGNVSKGVVAAAKGKQTKLANQAKWQADNADAIAYVRKRADKGSTFYQSFLAKMTEYGTLTEGQLALVYKDMAKDAEFFAAKKAEREAARPVIEISAIQTMFAKASEKLTKKPVFRMDGFQIETDRVVGHQTLWIKDTEQGKYVGKVEGGKFNAFRAANDKTLPALQAVAADPTGAAIAYARKFGACCCCGKTLRNPVSVLAVVGPVCGPRWGLDHLRMQAAAMLAAEEGGEA